jgi:hypothetical protein
MKTTPVFKAYAKDKDAQWVEVFADKNHNVVEAYAENACEMVIVKLVQVAADY